MCDVDGDGDVDVNDIRAIVGMRGQTVPPADANADVDGDGIITVGDARGCVLQCTLPRCADPGSIDPNDVDNDGDGVTENQGDCNDADPTIHPGATELCDGADNDCNGVVDDGIAPVSTSCGVGACAATGELICAGGALVDSCSPGPASAEVCDGADDDCNGVVDDGIAPVPTSCGVGACAASGEVTCVDGALVDSCVPGVGSAEVCDDGVDNDCDGLADAADVVDCPPAGACDGFVPEPTSCGIGACAATGVTTCADVAGQRVIGDTCLPGGPSPEVCDGLDNDCDGVVDNGDPGGGAACGTGQPGVCSAGTTSCSAGAVVCVADQVPSPEVCDGLDNDCDGIVDNGDPGGGAACDTGQVGVCSAGTTSCSGGAVVCVADQVPSPEVCDGLDNDCDGIVDNGDPGGGAACDTGQAGVCSAGTTSCSAGAVVCVADQVPSPEVCDGLDNDCDGVVDNGDPGGGAACVTGQPGVCSAGTTSCSAGALMCVADQAPSPEVCDGIDNDCDGVVPADEADADGDTFRICDGDCNDNDPAINPAATEIPGNQVDENCDGIIAPGGGGGSLTLALSQDVVNGGGTINIIPEARDGSGDLIVPTPAITYVISFQPTAAIGTAPTESGGVITTALDTRGVYTVEGTVDSTGATGSVDFVVIADAASAPQQALYAGLSVSINDIAVSMEALLPAVQNGDLVAIGTLNNAMKAARDAINLNDLMRSTAFAPEGGFPPTPAELIAAGFPETADDAALGPKLDQVMAKLDEITAFLVSLNPGSATDDEAVLNQLNADLDALLTDLQNLNPTVHGVVKFSSKYNVLLAETIPAYWHAMVNRIDTTLQQQGLAQHVSPAQFYVALGGVGAIPGAGLLAPGAFYAQEDPTFFGLLGLFAGSSLQVRLVQQIYGQALQRLQEMMILLVVDGLIDTFFNPMTLDGIITGASLSFHIFHAAGSVIEGSGFNDTASRNDVYLVGSNQVNAVQSLIDAFNADVDGRDLNSVKDYIDGIVNAVVGIAQSYQETVQPPSTVAPGCILGGGSSCKELVYDTGFNSVNKPQTGFIALNVPAPVIIMVYNKDTGWFATGVFDFVPSN